MTEDEMMNESEITSDDRLFAALAYFFSPIVPILILIMPDKKDRPFIRAHNAQALIIGILLWIIIPPIALFTLGCGSLIWLVMFYWAYQAYQGNIVNMPVISDFVKSQNWA